MRGVSGIPKCRDMIRTLEIQNFKSLGKCKISHLARVNLIVGKNNVGKSSLLEALTLLFADGSPRRIHELLAERGLAAYFRSVAANERDELMTRALSSLYTGRDATAFNKNPLSVSAEAEGGKKMRVMLRLGFVIRNYVRQENTLDFGVTADSGVELADDVRMYPGLFVTTADNERFYRFSDRGLLSPFRDVSEGNARFRFVRPSSVHSIDNALLFDGIAMTGLQKNLVGALNIIDPRIRDVNFLNDSMSLKSERVPIVVLDGDDTRYPLQSMGDGVNRILTIVLSMLNSKGGALLVDEFENGLHYTALCRLWEIIFRLSEELGVQVFVTSHSDDCIKSFIKADVRGQGALIRLESRKEGIVGVPYTDRDELNYIRDNDVEVR